MDFEEFEGYAQETMRLIERKIDNILVLYNEADIIVKEGRQPDAKNALAAMRLWKAHLDAIRRLS